MRENKKLEFSWSDDFGADKLSVARHRAALLYARRDPAWHRRNELLWVRVQAGQARQACAEGRWKVYAKCNFRICRTRYDSVNHCKILAKWVFRTGAKKFAPV